MVFIEGCQCLQLLVVLIGNMLLVTELMVVFVSPSISEIVGNMLVTELMVVFVSSIFSCASWKYVSY